MINIYQKSSPIRNELRYAARPAGFAGQTRAKVLSNELIKFDISPTLIIVFLGMAAVALGLLYLVTFNQVATKGYQLKKLEVSRQELKSQHDLKNLYLAKVRSYDYILNSGRLEPMGKPANVDFVYADSALAMAD
jgi:hypothetical protein